METLLFKLLTMSKQKTEIMKIRCCLQEITNLSPPCYRRRSTSAASAWRTPTTAAATSRATAAPPAAPASCRAADWAAGPASAPAPRPSPRSWRATRWCWRSRSRRGTRTRWWRCPGSAAPGWSRWAQQQQHVTSVTTTIFCHVDDDEESTKCYCGTSQKNIFSVLPLRLLSRNYKSPASDVKSYSWQPPDISCKYLICRWWLAASWL